MFLLEVIVGITPGSYHVDELTYLSPYTSDGIKFIDLPNFLFGRYYFLVASILKHNLFYLLALNYILYVLTSLILVEVIRRYFYSIDKGLIYLLFIIAFDPYRLHLSLHVVKEPIIFFLISISLLSGWFRYLSFIGVFFRLLFPAYFLLFLKINLKSFLLVILLFVFLVLSCYFLMPELFYAILKSNVDMRFRDFDTVPTFNEFNYLGSLLRSLIWPLMFVSGAFVLFMPSILVVPLLYTVFIFGVFYYFLIKRYGFYSVANASLGFFVLASIISFVTTGYTSFIRYLYPAFIMLPFVMISRLEKSKL